MTMAPHPDQMLEARERIAEGRATRRIELDGSSPSRIRLLRTQSMELNRYLSTDILDLISLISTGDSQWRTARSKALRYLNDFDRAMRTTIATVLTATDEQIEEMARFHAPQGQDSERTKEHGNSDGIAGHPDDANAGTQQQLDGVDPSPSSQRGDATA